MTKAEIIEQQSLLIRQLERTIRDLQKKIPGLEEQLHKSSNNSSKPPPSGGFSHPGGKFAEALRKNPKHKRQSLPFIHGFSASRYIQCESRVKNQSAQNGSNASKDM